MRPAFEELKSWFLAAMPGGFPPAPFKLLPWKTVLDTKGWLKKIREELNIAYSSRSKYGALQKEIEDAKEIWNLENIKRTQSAQSSKSLTVEPDELF
jgi:hypothetical protein